MKKALILLLTNFLMVAFANDFVTAEEAFISNVTSNADKLTIEVKLAKDIYLYQDKVSVRSAAPEYAVEYTLPKAKVHEGFDGPENIYTERLAFEAKLVQKSQSSAKEIKIILAFQGCSEQGLCYAPEERSYTISVPSELSGATPATTQTKSVEKKETTNEFEAVLEKGYFAVIALYFLGGVLLAFTPCLFPMIPILSSIIVSQGKNITPMRALFLSSVYVLAMAFAYTLAGVLAGLFGSNLQETMQMPIIIVAFSLMFVVLALSMFGFYEIKMPGFIQRAVTKKSQEAEGNGVWGVAIMGFLSALIVGPCMAAPLAGALAYIGDTGDAVLGGVALFALSIGMGLPLLVVGVGAGKFMPKPGGWMDKVTHIFGVIMLAVALWMLDRIVEDTIIMMMFAILLIISSVTFGTFEPIPDRSGGSRFFKGAGIVVFLFGLTYFVGSMTGGSLFDPLKGLQGSGTVITQQNSAPQFSKKVASIDELNALLEANRGQKVMLDFTAGWCASCKEFDEITFVDPKVSAALSEYLLVKVDITTPDDAKDALKRYLEVRTAPGIRFFDEEGKEVKKFRMDWYHNPQEFLSVLARKS